MGMLHQGMGILGIVMNRYDAADGCLRRILE